MYSLTGTQAILEEQKNNTITHIFESLNNSGIKYCHWKSNSHLDCSFESKCDFDLLIDRKDQSKFTRFLTHYNFKKKFSSANYVYPGFDDYFFFDKSSGNIFHFHVHYKLIIGKKHQKNYRLPLEKLILNTSVMHETFPIKVIIPEIEFVLLIIRLLLKFSFDLKTIKRLVLKRKIFPANILEEYSYLRNKIDTSLFNEYCSDLFSDLKSLFEVFISKKLDRIHLFRVVLLRTKIFRSLKNYRIYKKTEFEIQKRIRLLSAKANTSWLPAGGITIGFIGVDGAGKSTTIVIIKRWLQGKLSVQTFYMGLPKGNYVWEFYKLFFKTFKKLRISGLAKTFDILKNIYNAKTKLNTFISAEMAKNQGKIVIFDRYPVKELWDFEEPMDGPIIKNSPYWQAKEKEYYEKIKLPDYLFVLITEHEDAIKRKSEHQSEYKQNQIIAKNNSIFQLAKTKQDYLIPVNSSRKRDDVILEIKNKIWDLL